MRTTTRKCTRCQDMNGKPTGMVRGGVCFLCDGTLAYVRTDTDPTARPAGDRRYAAIRALDAAGITYRQAEARRHLEANAPERHAKLIESVLAGRVAAVLTALTDYAEEL